MTLVSQDRSSDTEGLVLKKLIVSVSLYANTTQPFLTTTLDDKIIISVN